MAKIGVIHPRSKCVYRFPVKHFIRMVTCHLPTAPHTISRSVGGYGKAKRKKKRRIY